MAIEKQISIDQTTVTENGTILIREAIRLIEDGVEINKQYHRSSLPPGADISFLPADVQVICKAAWTDDVINAYQTNQAEEAAKIAATQPTA
jgi:hypothetical protein